MQTLILIALISAVVSLITAYCVDKSWKEISVVLGVGEYYKSSSGRTKWRWVDHCRMCKNKKDFNPANN